MRKPHEKFHIDSPNISIEMNIAKEYIKLFQDWRANIDEEISEQETKDILRRYINRKGSDNQDDTPTTVGKIFSTEQITTKIKLPTEPREGDRFMVRGIRFEWKSTPEQKQEAYIGSFIEIMESLGKGEKAKYRFVRQGCDSNKTKEVQFREPYNLEQFHHIGKILQVLQEKPASICNLLYPPTRTHMLN